MRQKRFQVSSLTAAGLSAFLAISIVTIKAQQSAGAVKINDDDIGGVVTSSKGPEAGAWVIAETTDLGTRYSKTVVTDDRGRYLIPGLPKGTYTVWARGYGLVDSAKAKIVPGKNLNITAIIAPSARAAAEYYPSNYWFAMLQPPAKSEFPGTGPEGNGINPAMKSQEQWLRIMKTDSCESCHPLGSRGTRTISDSLGHFNSSVDAWDRRIQSGQAGTAMVGGITQLGRARALKMFADWTDRIAAGEYPKEAPPRPQGVERNVVITQWDWAGPTVYLHDEIATDRRNPRVNANGLLYGSLEVSADFLPVLDPVHNTTSQVKIHPRDADAPLATGPMMLKPSVYWGDEVVWKSQNSVHNPMFDEKGRVWFTSVIRKPENPAWCQEGSNNPSAKLTPTKVSARQLAMYDPKTKELSFIDTCFSTHHLVFAEDANNTLWTSSGGGGGVVGWLNTKMWDQTHDAAKSQGWTALVLDTNGNGKRDPYVEGEQKVATAPNGESLGSSSALNAAVDPTKDTRLNAAFYGVTVSPVDGSIWGTVLGFPGAVVRLNPGSHPPETALAEIYNLPWGNPKAVVPGYGPRGLDIDRNGVVWTVIASGHLASFDRRKCKGPLNGPKATGDQCPEGWTLYPDPGPQFKGVTDSGSADSNYYDWVDQFDTLGLGKNTPIATGSGSDALLALMPATGKFAVLRVPYPTGFFAKGMDGRIDDPKAGWKGKGVWTTWATRAPFHSETGKGTSSRVVKFQMRPDPLAD